MTDYNEEKAKKEKEISDLILEIQKTEILLHESRWGELSTHLQSLNVKYLAQTAFYNLANPCPPQNLQENAQNCINFLYTLLAAKSKDMEIRI